MKNGQKRHQDRGYLSGPTLGAGENVGRGILATAFYTGLRRGEVLYLTWPKVDMKNRVIRLEAEDTKDREARGTAIYEELYQVLRMIPRAPHDDYVFLYSGKPVRYIRPVLREPCEDAGINYE